MMKRATVGAVLVLAVAAVLATGCGGSSGSAGTDTGTASPGASIASDTRAEYPVVSPESANEKTVAANAERYYGYYVKYNKPNETSTTRLYTPPAGQKGKLIGYAVTAFSPKDKKGLYGSLQLVVVGDQVNTFGTQHLSSGYVPGKNALMDASLKMRFPFDLSGSTPKHPAKSAGEKAAIATMKAWLTKHGSKLGYDASNVALTGYVLYWGERPGLTNHLVAIVQPDSEMMAASWSN